MHILQLMVMIMTLAMAAVRTSSVFVSAASGDIINKEHHLNESLSSISSALDISQLFIRMKFWLGQQETLTSNNDYFLRNTYQLDNSSSHEMDILRVGIRDTTPKYLYKFPFNINLIFSEALSTHEEPITNTESAPNRTTYSVGSKQFLYSTIAESSLVNISSSSDASASLFACNESVAMSNSSTCFCNQCILHSDAEIDNATKSVYPECCYVKRFLNSGCLNTGKLALKVLQQCIVAGAKPSYHFQSVLHHNNKNITLLIETETIKVSELKQAHCVLKSLKHVYEWRKNYDAVNNNVVGDSDRHFNSERYRKLLFSLEATLESLPEFQDAANHLDAIGAACLDIIWAPVFTSALGKNRSTFERFLREERSKLKSTLLTGSMFRNYLDPTIYTLLIIFGLVSNGTLLLMFVRYKEMQTQRNVLLLNLVVVDLMNLTTVAPLYLLSKYGSSNLYAGEFGCRVFLCYRIIVRYNIEFSLVALTAQRYSAITSHRLSASTRALFYILSVWVMSVIATLPHIVSFVFRGDFSCFSFRKEPTEIGFLIDHALMMLLSLCVPAVVFVLSMLMAERLRRSIREMPGEGRQTFQKQESARNRSAHVVIALAVVFAFTHTPRALWFGLVPWSKIDRQSSAFLWIDGTLNYLYYLNSGLNPCAMYFSCSVFRTTFRRCFVCFFEHHESKQSNESQRTQQYYISQVSHL